MMILEVIFELNALLAYMLNRLSNGQLQRRRKSATTKDRQTDRQN